MVVIKLAALCLQVFIQTAQVGKKIETELFLQDSDLGFLARISKS